VLVLYNGRKDKNAQRFSPPLGSALRALTTKYSPGLVATSMLRVPGCWPFTSTDREQHDGVGQFAPPLRTTATLPPVTYHCSPASGGDTQPGGGALR
jgi:hypothetical protein